MTYNAPIDYKLRMKIYTIPISQNLYDYILFIIGVEQGGGVVGFQKNKTEFPKRPTEHTQIPKDSSRYIHVLHASQ